MVLLEYAKPFRDIAIVGHALNQKWNEIPAREQERIKSKLVSELLTDGVITAGGAALISKAPKFTTVLDTIAREAGELPLVSKVAGRRATKATAEAIEEAIKPVTDSGITFGTGGLKGKEISFDDLDRGHPRILAEEADVEDLIAVPENIAERMMHFNASSIEVRDAIKNLPDHIRREVIDGYLEGRVRIVESMQDVSDILK
ncbi:MAG: hypothetical protein K8F91_20045 [Candidatus Obscuribacterales bacterium]|nr:hypothetical protein [Candidatus Obscuribacterales bacterium]